MSCKDYADHQHERPIYFNFETGYIWICLACEKQLAGNLLSEQKKQDLLKFARVHVQQRADRAKEPKA